jgi:alkylation response protein AidB-like acyl-CoA dehydrogenase
MMGTANWSLDHVPGPERGLPTPHAVRHGTEEQKKLYLPKLVSGEWTGTMCLTEPHCGTDLGLSHQGRTARRRHLQDHRHQDLHLRRRARPGREHRPPGAGPPARRTPGTKGISLFVVPKFKVNADGSLGERNASSAAPRTQDGHPRPQAPPMNFDGAVGTMVAEPNKGLEAMFTLMNTARLGVAVPGVGPAEVAYQNALAYAKDRAPDAASPARKTPDKAADPMIVAPRRAPMLLTQKASPKAAAP